MSQNQGAKSSICPWQITGSSDDTSANTLLSDSQLQKVCLLQWLQFLPSWSAVPCPSFHSSCNAKLIGSSTTGNPQMWEQYYIVILSNIYWMTNCEPVLTTLLDLTTHHIMLIATEWEQIHEHDVMFQSLVSLASTIRVTAVRADN